MTVSAKTGLSRATPCVVANRVADNDPQSPFRLPTDGWWHVLGLGEVPARWEGGPHSGEDMVQVIDKEAVDTIKANFDSVASTAKAAGKQFAGLLVDYDHFSHNPDKPTEAGCWIFELESRPDGLWAKGRWTGTGEHKVTNGEYRFASGVLSNFVHLGGDRYRPTKLDRVALTNDPRLKNLEPITVPNRDNQQKKAMNERLILTELLGIASNSDDAAITAGVATLRAKIATASTDRATMADIKNRLTEAESKAKALGETVNRLNADLIEHDMKEFEPVIENKEAIKAALVANREGTLTVLRGLKPSASQKKANDKMEERKNKTPVYNRQENGGRNPGPVDGEADKDAQKKLAVMVRNRTNELIAANPRIGRANATMQAVREIETQEGVSIIPTQTTN